MSMRARRGLAWGVVGAVPGVAMVAFARLFLVGEMQLTVGAPGILLAVAGAAVGLVLGFRRGGND